jgi:hypothetical protein
MQTLLRAWNPNLKLQILLAGNHNYFVHVGDHHASLKQEWQIHDNVLMASSSTLHCFPAHLLVDFRMGDQV